MNIPDSPQKEGDQALHSDQIFAGLVEHSPFGVYVVDSQFRIRLVNDGAQAVFSNVRPLIGRNFDEALHILWPEPFASEALDRFRHTLKTGEAYIAPSLTNQRQDSKVIESYEWEIHRITLPDGQPGVVCYFFESTKLRQAEQALRDADRRKDAFLATLAHELRNPLAPVRNAVEVMKAKSQSDPELIWARDVIDRQVSQMARLLDDLLDVSRITCDRLELRKQRVELAAVIRGAVETCEPLVAGFSHKLAVNLPPGPIWLDADPVRLGQVFGNLFNNACKYTEPNGHIWVTAEQQGNEVLIKVRDTGIGIPAEKLDSVFDMFSQVDRAMERSQSGLGIGLHLVRRLLEMHGGTITAHSQGHGKGSEFVVKLPVLPEKAGEEQKAPAEPKRIIPQAANKRRILVVDDNIDAAKSLAMVLMRHGHQTQMAHDGAEAVEKAAAYEPDYVLLDIGLPGMSGYDACREIRKNISGRRPVVVALTGWGQEEDRAKSKEAGFDAHLVKPLDYAMLDKLLYTLSSTIDPAAASMPGSLS